MSDLGSIVTRSRRKQRSNKTKSYGSKTKQRKRKSRVSLEYQENEREVQALLKHTALSIDSKSSGGIAMDSETQSVQFFCKVGREEIAFGKRHELKMSDVKQGTTELAAENAQGTSDEEEDTDIEEDEEESEMPPEESATPSTVASSTHGQRTKASTYIQIDVNADTPTQLGVRTYHTFDCACLYKPSAALNAQFQIEGANKDKEQEHQQTLQLRPNTIRMLNRYLEEAIAADKQVTAEVFMALADLSSAQINFRKSNDVQRYRSFCAYKFHPIFCSPSPQTVQIPTRKFIKLYIRELRFTQHPQLLEEHRLANALDDAYDQYKARLAAKVCEQLQAQLQTERNIVNELLRCAANKDDIQQLDTLCERDLEHHLTGVRTLRNRLYQEEATTKQLLQDILDKWMQLKQLRKAQQFQCTRCQLRLKVNEIATRHVAVERQKWMYRFETDLNECYREELQLYYSAKRLWKQRDRSAPDTTTISRPRKPDIIQISGELKDQLALCLYAPDEPRVEVWRKRANDIELYVAIPTAGQKQHRLKRFFMKIYFDQDLVGATRTYRLEPDLRLAINEVIGIFVKRSSPKDIRIVLFEKSKLAAPKKIATMTLSVPLLPAKDAAYKTQNLDFSSQSQPPISGRLNLGLQCDEESFPSDMLSALLLPSKDTCDTTEAKSILWPANEAEEHEHEQAVASEVEDNVATPKSKSTISTCTFEENLLQFCARDELDENKRFKLLRSRYLKNDVRTRELRFIPALENELEYDWEAREEAVIDAGNWMDPIDLHKHQGKKYVKSLYEAIRSQCVRLNKVMENCEHLLLGDEPASWSSFFQTLGLLFHPTRPLNPNRNAVLMNNFHANAHPITLDSVQQFKVVLNVVRATGIPVRMEHNLNMSYSKQRGSVEGSSTFVASNLKYSNVRPFITLSYRDKMCRTMSAEGSNPTWNEQVVLQLSGDLNDLRDDLKISLFDEIIENHPNEEASMPSMDMYQRVQTNWLGEYRIPMSSILAIQKFDGVLELCTPNVLLGYKRPSLDNISSHTDTNISLEQYPEIKESVHLWYYLGIEPMVELPSVDTACLECSELKEVRQNLQQFKLQAKELQPQRFVEPLVCTVDGKRVCLTRLLEPVPLPSEASENLLDSACRFVSLLSLQRNYDACLSFQGVWLDNQLLLDTTWASAKDLGILLCNYLLTIGLQCWLALGIASPHGESAFVLYRNETGQLMFLHPCSGKRYSIKDVFCPLIKVYCVLSQDNFYYNIQRETRVSLTNFNFNDTSCWLPAFSKRNPAPLGGVQKLNYIYRVPSSTSELRKNIERKIIKKISVWRTMRKTIWNRAFQPRLHSILQHLEHVTTFNGNFHEDTKYAEQLVDEYPSYKIYGFTLNFPYTNLTCISERIKSTSIHLNSDKSVEFSLAVHLHAYPNNVISVWVFLISIVAA